MHDRSLLIGTISADIFELAQLWFARLIAGNKLDKMESPCGRL